MNDLFLKIHEQLPVFKVDYGVNDILYTPGVAIKIKAVRTDKLHQSFINPENIEDPLLRNAVHSIIKLAREASDNWELQKHSQFIADCFTIHVGSDCNLNCPYCYSREGGSDNKKKLFGFPGSDAIEKVFNYTAQGRTKNSEPISIVFHGSGEPTFHWQKLVNAFNTISGIARQKGLQIFTFIATNGCLTEEQTDWLAENMDLIGISCDGPPAIQQKQRPSSLTNYLSIENVCQRIQKKGGLFENRVTITPGSLPELKKITVYLIENCRTKNIRIEPVFLAGKSGFTADDADEFFDRFIESRKYAEQNGVGFSYAGIRMEELHGSFCDVLRNTFRLTADDATRNCFCFMDHRTEYITGEYLKEQSVYQPIPDINDLKRKAFRIPEECKNCINVFHCSRGCPDFCIFEDKFSDDRKPDPFRCRLHQLFAVEKIRSLVLNQ